MIGPSRILRTGPPRPAVKSVKAAGRLWKTSGGIGKAFKTENTDIATAALQLAVNDGAFDGAGLGEAELSVREDRLPSRLHPRVNRIWKIGLVDMAACHQSFLFKDAEGRLCCSNDPGLQDAPAALR